jgi:hypothetical protein
MVGHAGEHAHPSIRDGCCGKWTTSYVGVLRQKSRLAPGFSAAPYIDEQHTGMADEPCDASILQSYKTPPGGFDWKSRDIRMCVEDECSE